MQPDEIAQQGVMNLTGLLILTAIPVTAFALWCDYFERFVQARLAEREELNRAEELYRVRTAGFFITLFQILIFFGSTPIRHQHPLITYPLFTVACVTQLLLQKGLEGKIRAAVKSAHSTPEADTRPAWQALRTFVWTLITGLSYVFVILSSVFAFSVLGIMIHASMPVRVTLLLTGLATGVTTGLLATFSLGAFYVRNIMNAQALPSGELDTQLTSLFKEAGIEKPAFWIVDIPQFHFGSAMMAGFPSGKGLFRPGLFISSDIVRNLSEGEIRAVVLHEISHWKLHHLKKRFIYSTGLILCASIMTGASVLIAKLGMYSEQSQGTVGCVALLASFVFAFIQLGRQVRYQEIAADIHSVENLHAELDDLSSALRKLDKLNDELSHKRDPGTRLLSTGHPATEFRIRVLEKYFEKKALDAENALIAEKASSSSNSGSDEAA